MKAKHMLIMLMISAFLLGIISCSQERPENLQETNIPQNIPNVVDSNLEDYIFLFENTHEGELSYLVDFKDAASYGIRTTGEYKFFDNVSKKTRPDPLDDQAEIIYDKSDCHYLKSGANEYGTFYSIYDVYKSGDREYHYLHGTDILCKLFAFGDEGIPIEEMPTDEESAKKITDEFLDSIYGERFSSKYEFVKFPKSPYELYIVVYARMVEGYLTDETIKVCIGKDGRIATLNAPNINKFDYLIGSISKEKVDQAKDMLLSKLQSYDIENFQVVGMAITTDGSGNLYLSLRYSHTVEYMADPVEKIVYVNIVQ